jgi:hypothetical protein
MFKNKNKIKRQAVEAQNKTTPHTDSLPSSLLFSVFATTSFHVFHLLLTRATFPTHHVISRCQKSTNKCCVLLAFLILTIIFVDVAVFISVI